MTPLRISAAAQATGIPATTLRYWEQIGLITAPRTDSGYRVFDDHLLERLRFISAAKRLDLPLEVVRELVGTWDHDTCRSVKQRLQPMVEHRLTQTLAGVAELTALGDVLRAGLARLAELPDRDAPCDPGCSLLDNPAAPAMPGSGGPPIACSLAGGDHTERLARWHALLESASITRAGFGVTADVEAGRVEELVELVRDEQECCPFLGFRLDFRAATVRLTIAAASEEAQPFVDALLPSAPTR